MELRCFKLNISSLTKWNFFSETLLENFQQLYFEFSLQNSHAVDVQIQCMLTP